MRAMLPYYREDPTFWEPIMWDFLKFNRALQWTPNESITDFDPLGLGEPKFCTDGSAFQEDWGRPQYDGPALRALFAMEFAIEYLARGGKKEAVSQWIYRAELPALTLTKADLELTAVVHRYPSFDLWEEVLGVHFYTLRVQEEALAQGARFAAMMNDTFASEWYLQQGHAVHAKLDTWFWNGEVYVPTVQRVRGVEKPSQMDVAILLAALHTFSLHQFLQDPFLATVARFAQAFAKFPINNRTCGASECTHSTCCDSTVCGPALGRYPEDTYMGGHPWYLATLAMSEVHYRVGEALVQTLRSSSSSSAAATATAAGLLHVTQMSAPFFSPLAPGMHTVTLHMVRSFVDRGDRYLARVRAHTPPSGHLAEQYHGTSGCPWSAENLTWSYAAFLTATRARRQLIQAVEQAATTSELSTRIQAYEEPSIQPVSQALVLQHA